MKRFLLAVVVMSLMATALQAKTPPLKRTKAPDGASVYFIEPSNGATVTRTFDVKFGLKGMGVAPAGVDNAMTGHHHLLINVADEPDFSAPLPATDNILHFGGGQTETAVTLPPGKPSPMPWPSGWRTCRERWLSNPILARIPTTFTTSPGSPLGVTTQPSPIRPLRSSVTPGEGSR